MAETFLFNEIAGCSKKIFRSVAVDRAAGVSMISESISSNFSSSGVASRALRRLAGEAFSSLKSCRNVLLASSVALPLPEIAQRDP